MKKRSKKKSPRLVRKRWEEFQQAGMLWFVNRLLHFFGWVIVFECEDDGTVKKVWPAHTSWRGFPGAAEKEGYARVGAWLKKLHGGER